MLWEGSVSESASIKKNVSNYKRDSDISIIAIINVFCRHCVKISGRAPTASSTTSVEAGPRSAEEVEFR